MSVILFAGPLLDPEEANPKEIRRLEGILQDLNAQLETRGLPAYRDPASTQSELWSASLNDQWVINLHALLDSLNRDGQLGIELRHLLDPAENGVQYFPVDFPEPIPSQVEEDMLYGSCQGLLREIEALAGRLGIPLERFPQDSGDGTKQEEAWLALYAELAELGAPCTKLVWARHDLESVEAQIREFCELSGVDEDVFKVQLIDEHGSLEAYVEALNEDSPSDDENNLGLMITVVQHYHGCRCAIENGVTFGIG